MLNNLKNFGFGILAWHAVARFAIKPKTNHTD